MQLRKRNSRVCIPSSSITIPHSQVYLIVQVQVVKLSIGAEMLHAPVQGQVNAASLALNEHRVPVVIIQQAP